MRDVSEKAVTWRLAIAQAVIDMPAPVLARLKARTLDKGDALEVARAAAFLAAKRTSDLLPLCHPLPIEKLEVRYEFGEDSATASVTASATVFVEVGTHARTGVEMEALTAVSIAALTLYDMLKPHAGTALVIRDVLLLKKTGGKSDFIRNQKPRADHEPR